MLLSQLTASVRRLALVGLAKNTGKTETLAALLRELGEEGRRVGVTSVGRDGEERDVIDSRIEKPRVRLPAGSLVATTDGLLSDSRIPHTLLESTAVRTPLGRVLIASLREPGTIEVAGPSASEDVRAVSDAMLGHGAEQVLIDGAIDRRAASSPAVSDGLVLCTGAVLSPDLEEVVARTRDAVELVLLPAIPEHSDAGPQLRSLAGLTALVDQDDAIELEPRFVLTAQAHDIAELLDSRPRARWLTVAGALPEEFVRELASVLNRRRGELTVAVADPTKVFLAERGPDWYARQGLRIEVLHPIALCALTVNPVAPRSHSFDSAVLRALLGESVGVPIFDVKHPDYGATQGRKAPDRAGTEA